MFKLKEKFLNLSIEEKINFIIAAFVLVMLFLIGAFWFGMDMMSATRSFVGGEGIWAKAQKDATIEILQYAETFNEENYKAFKDHIRVPLVSKIARLEMNKENYSYEIAKSALVSSGTDPKDVPSMVRMYRWFGDAGIMRESIEIWDRADDLIAKLGMKGRSVHEIAESVDSRSELSQSQINELNKLIDEINTLNFGLTKLEDEFSDTLSAGSRILQQRLLVGMIIFAFVLSLLFLIFVTYIRDIVSKIDEAKSEFVYLASHQLKTPLTSISWYADRLKRNSDDLGDQYSKYLDKIIRNSNRMVRLVYDLLNVSRVEMGGFSVNPEEADITEIADEVLRDFNKDISDKDLNVEKDFEDDSIHLKVDKNLFELVIYNLLSNAVQYTEEGGTIKLKIDKVEKGEQINNKKAKQKSILLSISDNGVGIPEDEKDEIFEKFFRSENAKKKDTTGSGLGLYLVKSIIDQVKGDIWFKSKVGEGTTFYVTFPVSGMKKHEGRKELAPYK